MLLIVNPISGTHHNPRLPRLILNRMQALGLDNVELRLTEYGGHAFELARDAASRGVDAVIACGGDGTVNEVASALTGTSTALGILPNGSGNGLARHLGIPCNPLKAVDIIAGGDVRACDWCEAEGLPFFCAFGIGFDAAVAYRFALKKSRGLTTYVKSALEEFRTYTPRHYTITTDGKEVHAYAMLVSVCNASQFGNNAYIAPEASITDGVMDITIVEKTNLLQYTRLGISLMAGALRESHGLKMLRVKEAVIHRDDDGPVHVDGEPRQMGRDIHVKVHPAGLRIFVNSGRRPVKPWLTPLHLDKL